MVGRVQVGMHAGISPRSTNVRLWCFKFPHSRTHLCTSTCTHTHARTDASTRTHARTHACTHARMHACTHARTHAHTHTHTHTHTRTHARTLNIHTHTHTHFRGFDMLRLKIAKALAMRIMQAWQYWSYCDRRSRFAVFCSESHRRVCLCKVAHMHATAK